MDLGGFRVQRFNSNCSLAEFQRGRGTSSRVESKGGVGALQPQPFGNVLAEVEALELPLARSFPILAPNLPSKSHYFQFLSFQKNFII